MVSIVTRLGARWSQLRILAGEEMFLLQVSNLKMVPTQLPMRWVPGFFSGGKAAVAES
jgi:hypothetical protein